MKTAFFPQKIIIYLFLFLCPAFLTAQSTAVEIEALLATPAVTYAQAARFVLEASETATIQDPAEAFRFAAEKKWVPKNALPDAIARLDGISLLFMQSFDIKGGLLYSLTRSPHFAYREMEYNDVIQGRIDPAMQVSGDALLYMTSRMLAQKDEAAAVAAERELRRQQSEEAARQRAQREAERRAAREALAAEINTQLEELQVADTRATVTGSGVMISLSNIQFLADSTQLPESEMQKLQEIAQILRNIPGRRVLVAGHTALAGTQAGRLEISLARARAVADYLVFLGARRSHEITAVGYGAEYPVASNSTDEGMAANRRVEITIMEN